MTWTWELRMRPEDLPQDLPTFIERFGTDEQCHAYLVRQRWPDGFCCRGCGHHQAWRLGRRNIYECAACGQQHSLLKGTMFEQTKSGLAKWFLAIYLVSASKGGISALELQRQMGFGSYQTAWTWLHKIRRAMIRPGREPLGTHIEADETYVGGPDPGKRGRGAGGKIKVAGAVERGRGQARGRRLGRLRLAVVPDASAKSLEGFLCHNVARPAAVTTDGWAGYGGLAAAGYGHAPINLSAAWGDAAFASAGDPSGVQPRQALAARDPSRRRPRQAPAGLEFTFRFNRRTAKSISHRFARVIEHAAQLPPTTYRALVATPT